MKPSIFQKYMKWFPKEFAPSILIFYDTKTLNKLRIKNNGKRIFRIDFYEDFFFEISNGAAHCLFMYETNILKILLIDSEGQPVSKVEVSVSDPIELEHIPSEEKEAVKFILFGLALLTMEKEKRTSIFTAQRNKASVYYREGNEVKLKRIFDMKRLPAPEYRSPEPGLSGIKKKQHDVIGHWRTYKSGVKVYVKPHKRGDATLGIVTKLITD